MGLVGWILQYAHNSCNWLRRAYGSWTINFLEWPQIFLTPVVPSQPSPDYTTDFQD